MTEIRDPPDDGAIRPEREFWDPIHDLEGGLERGPISLRALLREILERIIEKRIEYYRPPEDLEE